MVQGDCSESPRLVQASAVMVLAWKSEVSPGEVKTMIADDRGKAEKDLWPMGSMSSDEDRFYTGPLLIVAILQIME